MRRGRDASVYVEQKDGLRGLCRPTSLGQSVPSIFTNATATGSNSPFANVANADARLIRRPVLNKIVEKRGPARWHFTMTLEVGHRKRKPVIDTDNRRQTIRQQSR
jgi:hypothetical protein